MQLATATPVPTRILWDPLVYSDLFWGLLTVFVLAVLAVLWAPTLIRRVKRGDRSRR